MPCRPAPRHRSAWTRRRSTSARRHWPRSRRNWRTPPTRGTRRTRCSSSASTPRPTAGTGAPSSPPATRTRPPTPPSSFPGPTPPGVPGQIDHIRKLQSYAGRYAKEGEAVAVISYLGYDTPESIPKAANPMRGLDAADDMRRFSDGLRVAHGEPKTHLSYIAHSYGSFAVGVADSEKGGLQADDIVTLGSPMVLGVTTPCLKPPTAPTTSAP
ncbi:alpha/beta hydrolase [Kitasatospora sp. NPDC057965]|uniref:alpha/beta hydrolase n=1 Tax=Kitasatospora sp. NPDC057965 TaxID=3346291 RepID=UPI0036DBAD8A